MPSGIGPSSVASMRLEPEAQVRCSDAVFGELADVVVDPIARRVTHLVVQPHHDHGLARLVPVALCADSGGADSGIELGCTVAELDALPGVQEFEYLRLGEPRVADPEWDVGVETVLAMPYYEAGGFEQGLPYDSHVAVTYDRVPKGDVEIRRASAVISADEHHVGHVDGFIVDGDGQITHVVLERGHLWGRREVTIPIGAVAKVENDIVTVSLTEHELGSLPATRVHRWTS
jgi:sporulation protein YlmC with PRC-barrel domain